MGFNGIFDRGYRVQYLARRDFLFPLCKRIAQRVPGMPVFAFACDQRFDVDGALEKPFATFFRRRTPYFGEKVGEEEKEKLRNFL